MGSGSPSRVLAVFVDRIRPIRVVSGHSGLWPDRWVHADDPGIKDLKGDVVRKLVYIAGGLALLTGCGSATQAAAPSSPAPASRTVAPATAAAASVPPTVGPTNPAQSPAPKPASINLQVIKRDGAAVVIAPVVIHGRTYQFIVDTGAEVTIIDQNYAAELGLQKTKNAPIPLAGVTGSGTAYLATINDWQIGKSKIPTSTITISTINLGLGIVGLLGSDVLSTFGKITINYGNQTASLG